MKRIGLWGTLVTLVVVILGALGSFVWLPLAQRDSGQTLFAAWCSALGVPKNWLVSTPVPAGAASEVTLTAGLLQQPSAQDIGHGATLALRCSMCHGPTSISFANSPNLTGQYAAVVYKQLRDFKSGVRSNPVMTPMAQSLSDTEMRQLAAYYASLPRPPSAYQARVAPAIVKVGAPMRNVAPCGACHGDADHTMASPWLGGEPAGYIRAQLLAFVSHERQNDINGQMRAMARGLTAQEIDAAAAYYAAAAPPAAAGGSP